MYVFVGCDDLVNTVFELARSLSRLQLSEEEMALFSAAVLLAPGETLTPMSATNLATYSPGFMCSQEKLTCAMVRLA